VLFAICLGGVTAEAHAFQVARVPLQAQREQALRTIEPRGVALTLPDAWQQSRSVSAGTPLSDTYEMSRQRGQRRCVVLLTAKGVLRKRRPSVGRSTVRLGSGTLRIATRGSSGGVRWYIGSLVSSPTEGSPAAFAYERAPARLRSPSRRWVAYEASIRTLAPNDQECQPEARARRGTLRVGIRSIRVVNAG